jgi:hypothetical protein
MRRFLPLASIVCLVVSACGRAGSESETAVKSGGTAAASAPSEVAEIGDLLIGARGDDGRFWRCRPLRGIQEVSVDPVSCRIASVSWR